MRDVTNNETLNQTLAPAARTVTATGTTVDTGRDGYARAANFVLGLWTDGVNTFTFEDSPDDSAWTAMVAAKLDFPVGLVAGVESGASIIIDAAAEDNVSFSVGLLSTQRYVRVVQTVSGGPGTGLVSGVDIVTGNLRAAGNAGQPMTSAGYQRTQPSI